MIELKAFPYLIKRKDLTNRTRLKPKGYKMTIKEALQYAKQYMDSIEARVLLKYILKKDNVYIISNGSMAITQEKEKDLINNVNKLKNGYPLQYITHNQEFMGLNFYVDENVLIPQPDTEVLVENTIKQALEYSHENSSNDFQIQNAIANEHDDKLKNNESASNLRILDLCTGSGAIAISLKKYLPNAEIFASDISKKALDIAKKNAKINKVQIKFIRSNMFENIKEKFDIIVSNPPYIKTTEISKLSKQVQNEPTLALDGGHDGLDFYKIIAKEAQKYLNKNGTLLLEIGFNQKKAVTNLFKGSTCLKDYAGNSRVVVWEKCWKIIAF